MYPSQYKRPDLLNNSVSTGQTHLNDIKIMNNNNVWFFVIPNKIANLNMQTLSIDLDLPWNLKQRKLQILTWANMSFIVANAMLAHIPKTKYQIVFFKTCWN